jgi:U1 small nuclear ribonucleoprotein
MMHLPKDLYNLFDNPPLKFWRVKRPKKIRTPMSGVATTISSCLSPPGGGENNKRELEIIPNPHDDSEAAIIKSKSDMQEHAKALREAEFTKRVQQRLSAWNPHAVDALRNKTEDGYTTLFVGRLSPATTEDTLKAAMMQYGEVVDVKIVKDVKTQVSKGYGFVQFANDGAFQKAYKGADGTKIDDSVVVVDVERARTVSTWVPQRFGGGLGGLPRGKGYKVRNGRGAPEPPPPKRWRGGGFKRMMR